MNMHNLDSDKRLPPGDWAAIDTHATRNDSALLLLRIVLACGLALLAWAFFQSNGGWWVWLILPAAFPAAMSAALWERQPNLARVLLWIAGFIVIATVVVGLVLLWMLSSVVSW